MTRPQRLSCPLSQQQVVDQYFLEHRAKVLDIAAFLDRVDRAPPAPGSTPGSTPDPGSVSGSFPENIPGQSPENISDSGGDKPEDFRLVAIRQAIQILVDGQPHRAKRILELLSDPTSAVVQSAPAKGAIGAWPRNIAIQQDRDSKD